MGLEQLIKFLIDNLKHLIPIAVVYQYQGGVMYKFGKYLKELSPGWHLKIPYIHTYAVVNVVDTTILLPAQTVRTNDDKEWIVRFSVGYRIISPDKYFNLVEDQKSALSDRGMMIGREAASVVDSSTFLDMDFKEVLISLLQKEVEEYGIEVYYMAAVEISCGKSFKLYNESSNLIV
jgi:regulator of protease activity HflC (stomatin/prohibitin superfamily)